MCDAVGNKGGPLEETSKAFTPRVLCPLMPGSYKTKESIIDLAPFSMLPTDGYVWLLIMKIVSGEGKKQKPVMCLTVEGQITKLRKRKG